MQPFKGTFDGDGKTIDNLVLEKEDQVAFFAKVESGAVRNLTFGAGCSFVISKAASSSSRIYAASLAVTATGTATFAEVVNKGTVMAAAEATGGAMAAILRSDNDTIAQVLSEVNGFAAIANYNSPEQTVIAGETAAIDEAIEKLSALKARCVKLAVSAAFHTKLMNSAAEEFKAAVSGFDFKAPNCDFYANLYGKKLEDFSDMPSFLAAPICSPVKFVDELNAMNAAGIENYIELGPNKVLTGLVKKTFKGANAVNIENNESLEKALEALK